MFYGLSFCDMWPTIPAGMPGSGCMGPVGSGYFDIYFCVLFGCFYWGLFSKGAAKFEILLIISYFLRSNVSSRLTTHETTRMPRFL